MARRFFTLDVFTERALSGNPLAVVIDAAGLDDVRMQAIAAEFNLSETVFVLEPRDPVNTARLRIFTATRELPFAGHPTVGTAALLAHTRAPDLLATQDLRIVLEEEVGDVACVVRHRKGQALAANFDLPKLPERLAGPPPSRSEIAQGLGLAPDDIGFDRHEPSSVHGRGSLSLRSRAVTGGHARRPAGRHALDRSRRSGDLPLYARGR